ncbi:hypothetical protein V865_002250 [Kwoniella europaea PYCC6329]|uniref:Uncharacterized protein n=1 Tax=Kwoniella europaea PYCC6329 TaxID=1423913 RepID=A0AAX4KDU4_9TREE
MQGVHSTTGSAITRDGLPVPPIPGPEFWKRIIGELDTALDRELEKVVYSNGLSEPYRITRKNLELVHEAERLMADRMVMAGSFIHPDEATVANIRGEQSFWLPLHLQAGEEYRSAIESADPSHLSIASMNEAMSRYNTKSLAISLAWDQANRELAEGKITMYQLVQCDPRPQERVDALLSTLPSTYADTANNGSVNTSAVAQNKSATGRDTIISRLLAQNARACLESQKEAKSISEMGRIMDEFSESEEYLKASSMTDVSKVRSEDWEVVLQVPRDHTPLPGV